MDIDVDCLSELDLPCVLLVSLNSLCVNSRVISTELLWGGGTMRGRAQ